MLLLPSPDSRKRGIILMLDRLGGDPIIEKTNAEPIVRNTDINRARMFERKHKVRNSERRVMRKNQ